ncbi:MAG: hypothetical protein ACF8GE_03570 [Phycisphaerales bacterium JB043]
MRITLALFVSVFVFGVLFLQSAGARDAPPQGREAFERMVAYLARDGGQWRAPNPRHDESNPRSPEAVGLWFTAPAGGNVLELTVVFHYGDRVRHSTRGYWYFHPGRDEIVYHEVSPGGAVRTGTAHFESEDTFVTLTEAFARDGSVTRNRGVNVLSEENSHHTTAYAMGDDGQWVEQNALSWTRVAVE